MSDAVIIEIVRAVPVVFAAIMSLIATIFSYLNRQKINELHVAVNGRLTELLAMTAKSSHAEGKLDKTP